MIEIKQFTKTNNWKFSVSQITFPNDWKQTFSFKWRNNIFFITIEKKSKALKLSLHKYQIKIIDNNWILTYINWHSNLNDLKETLKITMLNFWFKDNKISLIKNVDLNLEKETLKRYKQVWEHWEKLKKIKSIKTLKQLDQYVTDYKYLLSDFLEDYTKIEKFMESYKNKNESYLGYYSNFVDSIEKIIKTEFYKEWIIHWKEIFEIQEIIKAEKFYKENKPSDLIWELLSDFNKTIYKKEELKIIYNQAYENWHSCWLSEIMYEALELIDFLNKLNKNIKIKK